MGHYKKELASQTGRVRDCCCSAAGRVAGAMLAFARRGGWALHCEGERVRTSFLAQENRAMIFALASCEEFAELIEKL